MKTMMRLGSWGAAMVIGVAALGMLAPTPQAAAAAPKETPLKINAALKPKIDARIAPFKWAMSAKEALAAVEATIDDKYSKKIEAAYSPKQVDGYEKARDKEKKLLEGSVTEFKGGGGVSGYEMKAPGEFTYKNGEKALEVPRAGGGSRQLFFLNDHLWKVYDLVPLDAKDSELGDTWETSIDKLAAALGDKGKLYAEKTPSGSYYGTLIAIPQLALWSDGTTQVRLVNLTKREDMPNKTVGLAYEEVAYVDKLPSMRTNVESKATDAVVDKAGYAATASASATKKK